MKKRTRPLALLMAAAILGSTLTACGGGSDSGTNGSDSAVEGLAEDMALTDAPAEEITLPISTDGLELSFFAMPEPVITSKMKGYSEMTVHQTAEELTGVHINWREESYTDPKQKMNLMFSTGDTEDIVWDAWKHASGGPKKLLDEGLIVSLNPYIEKYAPNLKKLLQETPGLLEQISTDDGRIFMFPTIRLDPITRANSGFAIRKDWLDRAGLPVPETIDEWYTMLKTFQDMDMNGNGLKDECFVSMGFEKTSQSMDNFAVAYGLVAGTDLYVKDGQVKYGAYEPEFKDFVAEMANGTPKACLIPNSAHRILSSLILRWSTIWAGPIMVLSPVIWASSSPLAQTTPNMTWFPLRCPKLLMAKYIRELVVMVRWFPMAPLSVPPMKISLRR